MVKTATVASAQDLLALVEKSGVLADAGLQRAQEYAAKAGDARTLARKLVGESLLTKWQASQLINGFYQLDLGKYRLLDQIGNGRIGREFLAEHVNLGRRVAIKLVSRSLTADGDRLNQFLKESRRAVSLDHPHLVHTFDVDHDGPRYFVVTEYVEGEDLEKLVKRQGPCSLAQTVDLLTQAVEGLAHAAASEVLHGDLRPSNLVLDKNGSLKVVDLGFARLVDHAPNAPARDSDEQNVNEGTEYCAPEATNQTEGDLDLRADVFSLGQCLYYLLTGASPAVPSKSIKARLEAISSKRPEVPDPVCECYAKLTSPDATERPGSWQQVLIMLRELPAEPAHDSQPVAAVAQPAAGASSKRKPPVAKALPVAAEETPATKPAPSAEKPAPAEAEEPAPFIINTGDAKRLSSAGKKPANGQAATKQTAGEAATVEAKSASVASASNTNEAKAEPQSKKVEKKKLDVRLVLGGMIGGGVLLLLLSIGLVYFLMSGGETEVAENAESKKGNKAAEVASSAEESNPAETESNPEESNPTEDAPMAAATSADVKPETSAADSGPKPAEEEKPPQPSPETKSDAPAESKPETPPPMPAPAEPKAEEKPAPKPEQKPESKPESKPAPKPAGNPFQNLPAAVSLPPANETQIAELAPLSVPAEKLLLISLHGGETANRARQFFSLANANNGADPRNWEFTLSGKGTDAPTLIAKLHLTDDKLTFEWMPEAQSQPAAATLGNCLLQLTSGADARTMALRTPVEVEPATIDFEKGLTMKFAYENPPSGDSIKVALVGLDATMFPNPEPKQATAGGKEVTFMWFGEKPETRNVGVKLDVKDKAKGIDVTLIPQFRLDAQGKEEKLTRKTLPGHHSYFENGLKVLTLQSQAIDQNKSLKQDEKDRNKNLVNASMEEAKKQLEKVDKALELVQRAHQQGVVHVRVTHETAAGPVILAQTVGAPAPEKAKSEKK